MAAGRHLASTLLCLLLYQLSQIQVFQTVETVTISNKMKNLAKRSSVKFLQYNIVLSRLDLQLHTTMSTKGKLYPLQARL